MSEIIKEVTAEVAETPAAVVEKPAAKVDAKEEKKQEGGTAMDTDDAIREVITLPGHGGYIEYNGRRMSAKEFNTYHREKFGRASKHFRDQVLTKLKERHNRMKEAIQILKGKKAMQKVVTEKKAEVVTKAAPKTKVITKGGAKKATSEEVKN